MLDSRWFPATGHWSNHCWKYCSPTRSFMSARFVSNCVPYVALNLFGVTPEAAKDKLERSQ
jgi:hypothetical protein